MNRESIDLRYFDKGLYSNPDQEDIPLEAQAEGSYNLDVDTQGKLRGTPKQTTHTSYGDNGQVFGWIERNDGTWDLVYSDGTSTKIIQDFYGTPSESTLTGLSALSAQVIVPNNQEVHIGMGSANDSKWVGYISHGQFGGIAPSGIQVLTAEPTQPSGVHSVAIDTVTTTTTEEDAKFPRGNEYQYKISFVYDGYQESPLGGVTATQQVTDYVTQIKLKVTLTNYSSLNKRITGVKVYRRERQFFDDAQWTAYEDYLANIGRIGAKAGFDLDTDPSREALSARYRAGSFGAWGEYKLVDDIDINDSWVTSGSNKYIYSYDTNVVGATYYRNVGIEEDPYYTSIYYGLDYGIGTRCGSYLFVGKAKHERLPDDDAVHMIFRSKPYRFDTFDWVNDKLILPSVPKAMKSHRGKLYVWDENTTYVINPNTFQIEEEITGRGCSSQESVVATDYGLFWANQNGVYWSTLTEELLQPTKDNLSEPIKSQYQTAVGSYTPILTYNSPRSQLLVHLGNDVYAYHTVEKRWDYYQDFTLSEEDSNTGAFIGKDGETYTVNEGAIYKDFNSSTRNYWRFISKEFVIDDPSQDKKFYKLISDYTGTVTIEYSTDGGSTWTTASTENISTIRAKTIKLRLGAASTSAILDSISIIYRRLRGKR